MKLSDIVPFIIIPSLAFYGVVYGVDWAITIVEYYCYIMIAISVFVVYCSDFTDFGDEYIKKAKLSATNYGSVKRKFGYSLVVASACLLISYDHLLLGVLLVVPVFVNEYIADRIINANQQKTKG